MNAALVQHASSPAAPCWFCGQPEVLEIGNIPKVRWSRTLRPQAKPTPHPIPQSASVAALLWIGDPAGPGLCSL